MKKSFYFILWIVIYSILPIFNNEIINNISIILALVITFIVAVTINAIIPKTIEYERAQNFYPFLEDIYTNNIRSFAERLSSLMYKEIISSIYDIIALFLIIFIIFYFEIIKLQLLALFIIITTISIVRALSLYHGLSTVISNPTKHQCAETIEKLFKLDYSEYCNLRQDKSYIEILPPKPKHFKSFQILSLVFSIICIMLGIRYIIFSMYYMLSEYLLDDVGYLLIPLFFGILAIYVGVIDTISIIKQPKK